MQPQLSFVVTWHAKLAVAFLALVSTQIVSSSARAATYYVAPAPTGSAANPGSMAAPFATIAQAQAAAKAGDTVYLRGGTYAYTDADTADATGNAITLNKSGASGNRINYWAFAGETPVFDFSGIKATVRIKGFNVTGSYLYLKGLEIKGVPQNTTANHESWGIYNNGGTNNIYELLNLHHNMGPGLFFSKGGNNLVLNCDSHHNYDPNSSTGPGTNADGFGCHIGAGDTGNVFRGCRAWWNSDDGWDFIQAQEAVTVENSWAWYNGYLPDDTKVSSGGDGNGFKGGGYGVPALNVPATPPRHTIRSCLAFLNRASGFNANHHPVPDYWYNDTGFSNNASNFNMIGLLTNGQVANVGVLRNDLSYDGALINPSSDATFNSWTLPVTISDADFESLSFAGMDGRRQPDGSLPVLGFMRPRAGSDLIDKGTNVALPFLGVAPDLGAFEHDPSALGAGGAGGSSGSSGSSGMLGGAGAVGASGAVGAGGALGTGGAVDTGGALGASGAVGTGGALGTGGVVAGAGAANAGGPATGGASGTGPTLPETAGVTGNGGSSSGSAGASSGAAGGNGATSGCACGLTHSRGGWPNLLLCLGLLSVGSWRRSRCRAVRLQKA